MKLTRPAFAALVLLAPIGFAQADHGSVIRAGVEEVFSFFNTHTKTAS